MRLALAILCAAALVTGCGGDDDDTTVVETTTVIETQTVPAPDGGATAPTEPDDEPGDGANRDDGGTDDSGGAEAPRDCGRIAFAPNTDSGASGIEAIGADCATARAVARAAEGRSDDLAYQARDYICNGERSDDPPLAQVEWICIGPGREVVTFATT